MVRRASTGIFDGRARRGRLASMVTATATALPRMLARLDEARVAGAARYLAARFYGHAHGSRHPLDGGGDAIHRHECRLHLCGVCVDGNGNGVLARDIDHNVDRQLHSPEQLSSQFSGVDFGTLPGLPAIDAGSPAPGDDPIRFGASNMVSFSALGTSSSGTLYIRGRGDAQYAIRLVGATARVRIIPLRFALARVAARMTARLRTASRRGAGSRSPSTALSRRGCGRASTRRSSTCPRRALLSKRSHRLLPGSSIEIHFDQDKRRPAVRGKVVCDARSRTSSPDLVSLSRSDPLRSASPVARRRHRILGIQFPARERRLQRGRRAPATHSSM